MTQKLDAQGAYLDIGKWDDGSDQDGVSKIYIGCGMKGIYSIYFDYIKSGKPKEGSRHGWSYAYPERNTDIQIEINHLENEYLESVTCTYDEKQGLQSVEFKTNIRTVVPISPVNETQRFKTFTLAVKGKKIIGFHGSANITVYSLGAYFTWITPTRVEAKGGKGGRQWDDGYDHEDVSTIRVQGGYGGIQSIQFDYIRNGLLKKGQLRGVSNGGFTATYEIDYRKDEYVVSIEGYYDEGSRLIQGIQFRTNLRLLEMMGYAKGRKFTVASNGNKIIGFHGYADRRALISIGAYFTPTPCKLEGIGGPGQAVSWDDGSGYDGIRKVFVEAIYSDVKCIRFEYESKGKVVKTPRRRDVENEEEFVIDYPNEFITSVEGSVIGDVLIKSLTIKTSKGRTSRTFGDVTSGSKFVLEKPGHILVGFHGKEDRYLLGLGAYYRPLPPPPDAEKLEEEGGDGGDYWNDGNTFTGIGKIYIGLTENAIAFVKFTYIQNGRLVIGDDHGSKNVDDVQEFTLTDRDEYITSVEGDYDGTSGVITMLRFHTNKNSTMGVGFGTSSFILHKDGHKIVGFYGRSSNMLHQIGAYVLPII